MKTKTKTFLGILLFIAFIIVAFFAYKMLSSKFKPGNELTIPSSLPAGSPKSEDKPVTPAPDFTVYDKNGNAVKLSDYFGKPIVLNFWASWCPPCKEEMPFFNSTYEKVKDEVNFLMIDAVDNDRETVQRGDAFIAEQGYTFPVFFDTEMEATTAYGVTGLPSTLFIDSNGNIAAGRRGIIEEETLLAGIELIKGVPINSSTPSVEQKAEYHKITAEEAKKMLDQDASITLLDVRTTEEYNEKRIDGAILIPDYELEQKAETELPNKQAVILVYCRSGARSKGAANKLVSMGYTNVYDFGGIVSYPFETVSN